MQRLSNPPKGPRGASPSLRPGGARGGIQKRGRTSSPRIDRDGDLVLDAETAKSRVGKGRLNSPSLADRASSSTTSRGAGGRAGSKLTSSRAQAAIMRGLEGKQVNVKQPTRNSNNRLSASLRVYGLGQSKAASNADGGLESMIGWIQRKASPKSTRKEGLKITKSRITGDSTVIITASPEDIITIRTLEGFEFAGSTVSFKAEGPTAEEILGKPQMKEETSSATQEVKERLKGVLAVRYNVDMKLLNLSALANDAGLSEMGMFTGTTTPSKIFPALMAICDSLFRTRKDKIEAVESVSLTDNGLSTVTDILSLATTFPDLKNLDLSRNAFSDMAAFDGWKNRLRELNNLVLAENPIEQQLATSSLELLKQFPNLQVINSVQVRTSAEISAAKEAAKVVTIPFPLQSADFRDTSQVGEGFVRNMLPLYDADRQTLLSTYYDNDSRVSISINMNAPRDKSNSGEIPRWEKYTKHSRNLTKITHLPSRMNRQYIGLQKIWELWQDLPATRHPDLALEAHKYVIECNTLPGLIDPTGASPAGVDGLMVTLHGEFEEPNPNSEKSTEKAMRSFSRSFIIGPGGSPQQPIRVVSDMLSLRPWSPLAQPMNISPINQATLNPGQPQLVATTNTLNEEQLQQTMAAELMSRTGMTLEYAVLCLKETGWNLEQAFIAFTANKDKLPPAAFSVQQ